MKCSLAFARSEEVMIGEVILEVFTIAFLRAVVQFVCEIKIDWRWKKRR